MGTSAERDLEFDVDAGRLFQAFWQAIPAAGMSVIGADHSTGLIQANSAIGLASWGENIEVAIGAIGAARSRARVSSRLKFGLVDWGKNRKNVDAIEVAVRAVLASPQRHAQPAGWYADDSAPGQLRWWDGSQWTQNTSPRPS